MLKIFVDTAAWIALINADDALHSQAQQVRDRLRQQGAQLVTSEFVLLEVADALSSPSIRLQTARFIDGLRRSATLHVISASQEMLLDGWNLYRERADKDWGLTDCTSFVIMMQERIAEAFTSDHHFEQAGFTRLLSPE